MTAPSNELRGVDGDGPQVQLDLLEAGSRAGNGDSPVVRLSRRARRLSIRVYPDARVEVVAPPRVRPREIEAFVAAHRQWIEDKRAQALGLGADQAFDSGERLPERVDAVMESVGAATWGHSLKSLRPGGRVVVCGATSGPNPPADLARVFFLQLSIIGSTMGIRDELDALLRFCDEHALTPVIDATYPLAEADRALAQLASGATFGKIVVTA